MPLGSWAATRRRDVYAPAGASQEYLRIPGEALKPRDGRYVCSSPRSSGRPRTPIEVKLLAVDHPGFGGRVRRRALRAAGPGEAPSLPGRRGSGSPLSAVDDRGNDVLAGAARAATTSTSRTSRRTRYQGVVEPHDLMLDLGPDAGATRITALFLRGWIYPTDASINVALSQQSRVKPMTPSLEVRDANGQWTHGDRRTSASRRARTRRWSSISPASSRPAIITCAFARTCRSTGTRRSSRAKSPSRDGEGHDARAAVRRPALPRLLANVSKGRPLRPVLVRLRQREQGVAVAADRGRVHALRRRAAAARRAPTTCTSSWRPGDEATLEFDASSATRCRKAGRATSSSTRTAGSRTPI